MNIKELCIKYGCTKAKDISQSYSPVYDYFLAKLKNVENVLEVGVGYPKLMQKYIDESSIPNKMVYDIASLRVWRDYFKDAQIYGFDIDKRAMKEGENRIKTFLIDSTKTEDVINLMNSIDKKFDLIIDDGAHNTGSQIMTARNLLPYIKKGGLYFIEDTKNPNRLMRALRKWKPVLFDWTINGEGNDRLILIEL